MKYLSIFTLLLFIACAGAPVKVEPESLPSVSPEADQYDPETGLILKDGFKEVRTNCTTCHSAFWIIQGRADPVTWRSRLLRKRVKHNLRRIDGPTEKAILNYLTAYYAKP